MDFIEMKCPVCGGPLETRTAGYQCSYCGTRFEKDMVSKEAERILSALDHDKQEKLANARRNLFDVTHEKYLSAERIQDAVRRVKELNPDDVLACFYDTFLRDREALPEYLLSFDIVNNASYLKFIIEFTIRNLDFPCIVALKDLVDRGIRDTKEKYDYNTRIEEEAEKLNQGLYNLDIDRDVFLCYSSKDMKTVVEITNFLEEQGLSCFVALRNLRHGIGSFENYHDYIFKAMRHCKCVLFLSSVNSRQYSCEALKEELPYLKDYLQGTKRIEYLVDEYGSNENVFAVRLIQQTFAGLEWSKSLDDLVDRLSSVVFDVKAEEPIPEIKEEVKYCVSCFGRNPIDMKFCGRCGGQEFRETPEEALAAYRTRLVKKAQLKESEPVPVKEEKVKYCCSCLSENSIDTKFCCNCGFTEFKEMLEDAKLCKKDSDNQKKEEERKAREAEEEKLRLERFMDSCEKGLIIEFGTFAGKPIEWRILSNDGYDVLLLSEHVLEQRKFDSGSNNYAGSEIRKYLNGEFFEKCFTEEEKKRILMTDVDNSARSTNPYDDPTWNNQGENNYACENTQDKLFLLSVADISNPDYGFSRFGGDNSIASDLHGNWNDGSGFDWWLRSPDHGYDHVTYYVNGNGYNSCIRSDNDFMYLRPAIRIRFDEDFLVVQKEKAEKKMPIEFGTYDGKPIEWKILFNDGEKALLLSKCLLEHRAFDSRGNNYANSEIRKYLNGEFLANCFTEEERAKILLTDVDNSVRSINPHGEPIRSDSDNDPYVCENTRDKVFLLSVDDVTNPDYGFSNDHDTDEIRIAFYRDRHDRDWWLRSHWIVSYQGYLHVAFDYDDSDSEYGPAVRPAIWISL